MYGSRLDLKRGSVINLRTSFGLSISFDGRWTAKVQLSGNYMGQTCGICGNFNQEKNDDFVMRNGTSVAHVTKAQAYFMIGNSYKIADDTFG